MIRIRQIKIDIDSNQDERLKNSILKRLQIIESELLSYKIKKKSLDARDKSKLYYVYEVDVLVNNEKNILKKNKDKDISLVEENKNKLLITGEENYKYRPIIVGAGPAGLFSAYILAKYGYKPLIIERGEKIDDRVKSVNAFFNNNTLNENSNVQFGEGGAGTFSDGKLTTLVKDKDNLINKVLEIFVDNGAPVEILYLNKPHIGTDLLREVIINIRKKIIAWGGEFKYNSKLTNIITIDNRINSIEINNKEIIPCDNLILAIGNSARDTFELLYEKGLDMESKPFAVGVRIQHSQELINKNQYGEHYKKLEPASYKLTYTTSKKRGVYSFCMCPGGYVINSSSEKGYLAINGMSNHKRDSGIANSAIVVAVNSKDYGEGVFAGVDFQRKLEKKAYDIGNGLIPTQLYKDFKNNTITKEEIRGMFKGNIANSNLKEIFPEFITEALIEGIDNFSTKIKGFNNDNVILSAVESRTSCPIRIKRDINFESNIKGIYPIGEGAGYAGGITTCAIDGIKLASKFLEKYKPGGENNDRNS